MYTKHIKTKLLGNLSDLPTSIWHLDCYDAKITGDASELPESIVKCF